jgi:hypothetical protein
MVHSVKSNSKRKILRSFQGCADEVQCSDEQKKVMDVHVCFNGRVISDCEHRGENVVTSAAVRGKKETENGKKGEKIERGRDR